MEKKLKQRNDYGALANKIAKKSSITDRYQKADAYLGIDQEIEKTPPREKIIRKTYSITKNDLKAISDLKKRYISNQVGDVADSHLIRLGLLALSRMSDDALVKISSEIVIPPTGRLKSYS